MEGRGDAEVPAGLSFGSATYLTPILPATGDCNEGRSTFKGQAQEGRRSLCGPAILHQPMRSPVRTGVGPLVAGPAHQVPQMSASGKLTRAQQSELEMARRRAQKAAQGKAANTASARRAKRRALDSEAQGSDGEMQPKQSAVTDEKEAKRLKR